MNSDSSYALKKKRLLVIGPVPPPYSGPELGIESLLKSHILNDAFEVFHLNTSLRKSNAERGRLDLTMVAAFIKYFPRLIYRLTINRPHYILYGVMSATPKGWVRDGTTLIICSLFQRKPYMQFRGGHFSHFYHSLTRLSKFVIRRLLNLSAGVLVQAEILKEQFHELTSSQKIHVVYNSIPTEFYHRFDNIHRPSNGKPTRLLFVGHLSAAKGFCDLLSVFADLAHKHSIELHCIGSKLEVERNVYVDQSTGEPINLQSPTSAIAEYLTTPMLSELAFFHGARVTGNEKVNIFSTSDIFVLPSYSEGFSRAILEAMAAALPIVTTGVGAVPEILEDGQSALIISPGDREALGQAIESLVVNPQLREELGRSARRHCGNRFVKDIAAEQIIYILKPTEIC